MIKPVFVTPSGKPMMYKKEFETETLTVKFARVKH